MAHLFRIDRLIPPTITLCTLTAALHSPTSLAAVLSVGRLGSGDGTIKDTANFEMECGANCSHDYPRNTSVKLTAIPDPYSQFVAWSAGVCAGEPDVCDLATDSTAQTITAYFSGAGLAAGGSHTVAIDAEGAVWVWGLNDAGQLGTGGASVQPVPVRLDNLDESKVVAIASGYQHTVALTGAGMIYGWGSNTKGQLGNGNFTSKNRPEPVADLGGIITFSAGYEHTMALNGEGQVYAWGDNTKGQLGDGTTTTQSKPVLLTTIDRVIAIATGNSHTVALRNDGTVWAWGDNAKGQMGDGKPSETPRRLPAQITHSDLKGIVAIDAGARHTVALRNDGKVFAWGDNGMGQLGDKSRILRSTPVQVKSDLPGIRAIAAGERHTAVLTHDGTVWTWGDNGTGQLGVPLETEQRSAPEQVAGLANIKAITAGVGHTAVITKDGGVLAFGSGISGELGNGALLDEPIPVAAQGLNLFTGTVTPTKYTVTVQKTGTGSGTVRGAGTFEAGSMVTLTATAASGSTFKGWSPSPCATTFVMPSYDVGCTAMFTLNPTTTYYTVSATVATRIGGRILPTSQKVAQGSTTTFTVTAPAIRPRPSFTVTGCGGRLSGNTYTTGKITANCTVTATFTAPVKKYPVTVNTAGNGTGTVSGTGSFTTGTMVTLTASPASGSTFAGWSPSPCATNFAMPAKALACTATFTRNTYTVTASAGTGGSISPASQIVTAGNATSFTVAANSGYVIASVTGCSGNLSGSIYVTATVNSNCAVVATFAEIAKYRVDVQSAGTGSGTVSGAGSFTAGTMVTLAASPASGSIFAGWSPSPCATNFAMPAKALTCTATFTRNTYTVTTTASSGGTIDPTSRTVLSGNTATFTVTPNAGYQAGVSGCGGTLSGTTYTTGLITEDCTVAANFTYTAIVDVTVGGTFVATTGADVFVYKFDMVAGRATTTYAGGVATITGFDKTQDILRFDDTSTTTASTKAAFVAMNGVNGVVIHYDPFSTAMLITFDPSSTGIAGRVELIGSYEDDLSDIVIELM